MFVCTFYSFKGGVGRTLALMNVAANLVKKGRRVLVVDFDLEAPGLTTFEACRTARGKAGMVEFVSAYRLSGKAPAARDFIHECQLVEKTDDASSKAIDGLSVMPAGNVEDSNYSALFSKIDWRTLYNDENGFLLIEDLKEQWADLGFDYVLIDSRTGHTDISGICTRQLPDAIAAVFFPNEQNLSGLKQIVNDVRQEPSADEPISLHFVASRVPKLDDEYEILNTWLKRFQSEINYSDENLSMVHHYDSLSLLDQKIFVLERPKSSLSKELRDLSNSISKLNAEDADGAALYLTDINNSDNISSRFTARDSFNGEKYDEIRKKISKIKEFHQGDYVLMFLASLFFYSKSVLHDAASTVELAVASIGNTAVDIINGDQMISGIHLLRMRIYRELDNLEASTSSAISLLKLPSISGSMVRDSLATILAADENLLPEADDIPALSSLNMKEIATSFLSLESNLFVTQYSARVLKSMIAMHGFDKLSVDDRLNIGLRFIAGSQFESALKILDSFPTDESFYETAFAFNRAIAHWAINKLPDASEFGHVLESGLKLIDEFDQDANFYQCIALSASIVGNSALAIQLANKAISLADGQAGGVFDCWSFMTVSSEEFIINCHKLINYISHDGPEPEVLHRSADNVMHSISDQ